MIETLNELGEAWWAWIVPLCWQVALLAAVIWAIDLALRRRGWPQVRHGLWLLVLVKLFIPPTFAVPSSVSSRLLDMGKAGHVQTAPEPEPRPPALPQVDVPMAAPAPPLTAPDVTPVAAPVAEPAGPRLSLAACAMLLAGLTSVLLLAWVVGRARRLRRLVRDATGGQCPVWLSEGLGECARQLKLRRVPRLVVTDRVPSAAVFGVVRPVLLLPSQVCNSTPREHMAYVLLHELAHIKRGDLVLNAAQTLAHVVFWFHPFVWLAGRRLRHLRELCCDATVSAILREQTAQYRLVLMEAAQRLASRRIEPGLGLLGLFESTARLFQRLEHLERPGWKHPRLRWFVGACAVLAMLACVVPMGALEGAGAGQPVDSDEVAPVAVEGVPGQQDGLRRIPYDGVRINAWWPERGPTWRDRGDVWVTIDWQMYWPYRGGQNVAFTREGPRVYVSVDGRARQLAGIRLRTPQDLPALQAALVQAPGPLVVWCEYPVLDRLPALPHADKISAIQVRQTVRARDISPLARLPHLQAVCLSQCEDLADLSPLGGLAHLVALKIVECPRVADLSPVRRLAKLRSLSLDQCENVADLTPVGELAGLERLKARYCKQLHDLSPLAKLTSLEDLNLSLCPKISDLRPLAGLTRMRHLNLLRCIGVSDISPLAGMKDLRTLWIGQMEKIADISLVARFKHLTGLSITELKQVTDISAVAKLTELRDLRMNSCRGVTDIRPLAGLVKLTRLEMWECDGVTDLGPLANLRGLTSFYAPSSITDREFAKLMPRYPELSALMLMRCRRLTHLGPLTGHAKLKYVSIYDCPALADLSALAEVPALESLNLNLTGRVPDLSFVGRLGGLRSLSIRGQSSAAKLPPLGDLKNLTRLLLFGFGEATDLSPLARLSNLEGLSLDYACKSASDFGPIGRLTKVKSLRLRGCHGLSDLGPLARLTRLEGIHLADCQRVADLTPLAKLPNLRSVAVRRCPLVWDLEPLRGVVSRHGWVEVDTRLKSQLADLVAGRAVRKPPASKPLTVGQAAPAFECQSLDGKPLRLADYRGKYVILVFWSSSDHSELGKLRHFQYFVGPDDRFALVGLNLDDDIETPRRMVAGLRMRGIQGFVGDPMRNPIQFEYGVQRTPAFFLIDPAGRIVAKGFNADMATAAVALALSRQSPATLTPVARADRRATVPVSGSVTLDGRPLASGQILFLPHPHKGKPTRVAFGIIRNGQADALTTYATGDGATPGRNRVEIHDIQGDDLTRAAGRIPAWYRGRSSRLHFQVTPGQPNRFRFDLARRPPRRTVAPRSLTAPVTGEVTVNGRPLRMGAVTLVPDRSKGNKGRAATGMVHEGKVAKTTTYNVGDGAILGWHRVEVSAMAGAGTDPSSTRNMAPPQYNSRTTLTFEVKEGERNHFRFDLKIPGYTP